MAEPVKISRKAKFAGKIDYDRIDAIIDEYIKGLSADREPEDNKLCLFSGGSASTVGSLVRAVGNNNFYAKDAFKIDSEAVAAWGIIPALTHDAKLTKHAEKYTAAAVARFNDKQECILAAEDHLSAHVQPPFMTSDTRTHVLQSGEEIKVPKGYVYSSLEGATKMIGLDGHDHAFREAVLYMTARVFEKGHAKGISVIIDDHLECLRFSKTLLNIAKSYEAETSYIVSFVKPIRALDRAKQRFFEEGHGTDRAFSIDPLVQIATHLHQPRNWRVLKKLADTSMLTQKNRDGHPPEIVAYVCIIDGKLTERIVDKEQFRRFNLIDKIPKNPADALRDIKYTPNGEHGTHSFPMFISGLANDDTSLDNRRSLHSKLRRLTGDGHARG